MTNVLWSGVLFGVFWGWSSCSCATLNVLPVLTTIDQYLFTVGLEASQELQRLLWHPGSTPRSGPVGGTVYSASGRAADVPGLLAWCDKGWQIAPRMGFN
jgi:hypothetical protein